MRAEHLMSGFGIGPYLDRCWFVPLTVLQGSSTAANRDVECRDSRFANVPMVVAFVGVLAKIQTSEDVVDRGMSDGLREYWSYPGVAML